MDVRACLGPSLDWKPCAKGSLVGRAAESGLVVVVVVAVGFEN